jgi:hypothetical protein
MADLNGPNRLINKALKEFRKSVSKSEPAFAKLLIEWVSKFRTTNGNISQSKANQKRMAAFKSAVNRFLLRSGYDAAVTEFIAAYDPLSDEIREIHKDLNGLKIKKSDVNRYKTFAISQTVDGLQKQGLNQSLVNPVRNELFIAVSNGASLQNTIKSLETQLISTPDKNGRLMSNSIQVSRDALGQYEGTVNQGIAKQFGLDAFLYVGSLVKDSRPQCERWTQYIKHGKKGLILVDDLESEIQWALNNGTGFITDTVPDTFCQNRGGYNCRHTCYPVRSSVYIKPK